MKTCRSLQTLALAALLAGCVSGPSPSPEPNKEIVAQYFERWANHLDTAFADEWIAPDLVLRNPPLTHRSLAEYKASMTGFHAAFPDLRFEVRELIGEHDRVVARWTMSGTQQSELPGRRPNGRRMTIDGVSIFRIKGQKIREIDVQMDRLAMERQLGWLPPATPVK